VLWICSEQIENFIRRG